MTQQVWDYRLTLFNRAGKWVGSSLAYTQTQIAEQFRAMAFPGYTGEVGRWDEAAQDYVTYITLTTLGAAPREEEMHR